MLLTKIELETAYLQMCRIRKFEEQVHEFFIKGKLYGTTHLYIGQEACAVGACTALKKEDYITSTHRGHGHAIAKGANLDFMMAEILGKETGYCKGRGGSMHIGHISHQNLGATGVVGGGIAIATGAALAQKMRGEMGITLCFFGDGSTNEGSFHESLNIASVWKLPVIFFCENNQYGLSTPTRKSMNIDSIAQRGIAYNIKVIEIDGNIVEDVYNAVKEARVYVKTEGPILIVANTYRHMGHSKSDCNIYRTQEEIDQWKKRDPLLLLKNILKKEGSTKKNLQIVEKQAEEEVQRAVIFAEHSPSPSVKNLYRDLYAQ